MANFALLPADKQNTALTDIWDAIRTCEFNVLLHREKARKVLGRARAIEISAGMLAAVAGIGILSGIKSIPDSIWAIIAFLSGISGQLRSVFGLPDLELQHRRLQNDYSSVLSSLKGVVDRAKDADGLTYELDVQRRLIFERFHFVAERDDTDYDAEELAPMQEKINRMYPPGQLWTPPGS